MIEWPSYSEMVAELRQPIDNEQSLPIAVLRNVTLEPLAEFVRYAARQIGWRAELHFGGYDTSWQEACGALPMPRTDPSVVMVYLHLRALAPKLATELVGLSPVQLDEAVEWVAQHVRGMIRGIRGATAAPLIWVGFVLEPDPLLGIFDSQAPMGQREVLLRLNQALIEELKAHPAAHFLNLETCLARCGRDSFFDARQWHISRAPFGRGGLREIADEAGKFVRALTGKAKKCVVLDCDDTLWGGVVGEVGVSGIALGSTYPGSVFREFQQEIAALHDKGVIVALCSKNNARDVWEVFREHPDMVLRESHIAAAHISWADKASGLRALASELNIGLDSMVFVDDSEFEINLVRAALPQVQCLLLKKDQLTGRLGLLTRSGMFEVLQISDEDRTRGQMYRAERMRRDAKSEAVDLESYLRSLQMRVTIGSADAQSIARISQLTQRTNQFNLTTRRYSEAEVGEKATAADLDVLWLRLEDRFGDSGLCGVAIVRYEAEVAEIDTLLLSCRVLGRTIEYAFMETLLDRCRRRKCSRVLGVYRPSKKNQQVEGFYPSVGFSTVVDSQADGELVFEYVLSERVTLPRHYADVVTRFDPKEPQ